MLLKDDEIAKLKMKSTYEDDDWVIPAFVLKAKEVCLPKVNGRAVMEKEKDEREMEIQNRSNGSQEVDGGGSRSTGDSESDHEQNYQKHASKTAKENICFKGQPRNQQVSKFHQTKKEQPDHAPLGNVPSHLRKSGKDFPPQAEGASMVKNQRVNAQLAPLDNNNCGSGNGKAHGGHGSLPPPMTREELMNLEKNNKNTSIEALLN